MSLIYIISNWHGPKGLKYLAPIVALSERAVGFYFQCYPYSGLELLKYQLRPSIINGLVSAGLAYSRQQLQRMVGGKAFAPGQWGTSKNGGCCQSSGIDARHSLC
jgi:hypothetical protein